MNTMADRFDAADANDDLMLAQLEALLRAEKSDKPN